jgi:3-deoxy-7-phosphoheptulonate synthase
MMYQTDDVRIREIKELAPPAHLMREFAATPEVSRLVYETRVAVRDIVHGQDDRVFVVVGPCSVHDVQAAFEYASRLKPVRARTSDALEIIMRVYFEKPRTTVGWKGLINDPDLDGSFRINKGLRLARKLLLDVNELGVPAATEYLDTISPQYVADLISWGAIGARTTESQVHRELASGLSCPVGFKNGTDGNVKIAIDAIRAARQPHHFLSVTKGGISAIVHTAGNEDCHVVLRGGKTPNYDNASVRAVADSLSCEGLPSRLMIDCSHSNSNKQPENQLKVAEDVAHQIEAGEVAIAGVMLESNLAAGRQDLIAGRPLEYGKSITDACIGWEDTERVLDRLAEAVRRRRTATHYGIRNTQYAIRNTEHAARAAS